MAGDGISVNTTLSQVTNVARAQAKGQAPQADPAAAQKTLREHKRVDRIKQTEETNRTRIDPDEQRRREPDEQDGAPTDGETTESESAEETGAARGTVIDTKA